jgi:two-component system, NtrC family, response regulator
LKTILIIDDEEKLRSLIARIVRPEGFMVVEAGTCKSGLTALEQNDIDAVLCDVKLPDGNGVNLIPKLLSVNPSVEVILLTAYGNIPDGVQAMKNGAFDYIVKGDDNDKIIPLLHKAVEKSLLKKRLAHLEQRIDEKYSFGAVMGTSPAISEAISLAKKVAPTGTTVLLTGETGTGKEVFANAIHQASGRAGKNFIALNCSTFSREILESELFGYKQGAFTGANKDKKGLIEEADGGTLFLDEIGEMSLELQAKMLRVLESNEFIKLGDTKTSRSDFRLIAATNRNLKTESEEKRFRADLYFRLNVFEIALPALRERSKDITPIANHFARHFAEKTNQKVPVIAPDALNKLSKYSWPGNIRELKNVIERAVILTSGPELSLENLPYEILHQEGGHGPSGLSLHEIEKLHIRKVLNYTKGNKAESARLLEIGIATLYRKIEEYDLS